MKTNDRRVQRLAQLIRAELARALLEDVSDPSLRGISLQDVELSGDMKHAKVFYAHGATEEPSEVDKNQALKAEKGFQRAQAFLKKKLADNLELRYVPTLEFHRDAHADSVTRLYHLFDEVHREACE